MIIVWEVVAKWTALMSDPAIRALMKHVPQDADLETISFKSVIPKEISAGWDTRQRIIGFLNDLFYATFDLAVGEARANIFENGKVPFLWWYEMRYRLKKLIYISCVLESANLKSFGATPTEMDIPQSILYLWHFISTDPRFYHAEQVFSDILTTSRGGVIEMKSLYTRV